MSDRTYARVLAGAALLLGGVLALRAPGLGDYTTDAGPALAAVAHWHLGAFFSHQPAMGTVSLYVRAPFVLIAGALGDGTVGLYRWGALPCLLSVALVAVWLGRIALSRGSGRIAPVVIVAVALINPLTNDALFWGHPEELLTASLAVGALLAAVERKSLATAILAGLAVASKQWALLVIAPSILVLERERLRTLLLALGSAALATVPMAVANFHAFRHALAYIATPQPVVTAFSWLYPLSPAGTVRVSNIFGDQRMIEGHRLVQALGTPARPLITILGLAIPLLVWWRAGRRPTLEAMLCATALVFVLRCALDPGSEPYYHFPILLLLLALDAIAARRIPIAGLVGAAVAFVVLDRMGSYLPTGAANAVYIAVSAIACVVLTQRIRSARWRAPARELIASPVV